MVKYGDATDVKVGDVDTGLNTDYTVVYASSNGNCRNSASLYAIQALHSHAFSSSLLGTF